MAWVTVDHPTNDELTACVQCGLCLPQCPTFRLTGKETASPRGRLQAMNAVDAGIVDVDKTFDTIMSFCLGCRACEPVCPGMVPYGRALEGTRAEIVAQRPSISHRIRAFVTGRLLASRGTLRFGSGALIAVQTVGLSRLAPRRYRRVSNGLRRLRDRGKPTVGHAGGSGTAGTVGLLSGCIQDEWFRPTNRAAIALLEMAGYRVEVPEAQTCCGALAAHDGKAPEARSLAARNKAVFDGYDLVVATAAGCSAHMREYDHWAEGGGDLAEKTVDVTVAVARAIEGGRLPQLPPGRGRMGVQDPCHLRHGQRVIRAPRLIIEAAGYEVVDVDPTGMCCGAAGLYTILQPEASQELGNRKGEQIRSSGVDRVASANPGCEMQLRSATDGEVEIAHPIEWYLAALESAGRPGNVFAVEMPS